MHVILPLHLKENCNSKVDSNDVILVDYHNYQGLTTTKIELESHLLLFPKSGRKIVDTPYGMRELVVGEGLLLKKGFYLIREQPDSSSGHQSELVFFTDEWLKDKLWPTIEKLPPRASNELEDSPAQILPNGEFGHLFENFFQPVWLAQETPIQKALLETKVLELLLYIASKRNLSHFSPFQEKTKGKQPNLVSLMHHNYQRNLSLKEYAFLMGMSVSTFKRRFEEQFQESPAKWIRKRRLQWAVDLLTEKQCSVSEVAKTVGFESTSHFIQAFKLEFNTTPKKVQRRQRA